MRKRTENNGLRLETSHCLQRKNSGGKVREEPLTNAYGADSARLAGLLLGDRLVSVKLWGAIKKQGQLRSHEFSPT